MRWAQLTFYLLVALLATVNANVKDIGELKPVLDYFMTGWPSDTIESAYSDAVHPMIESIHHTITKARKVFFPAPYNPKKVPMRGKRSLEDIPVGIETKHEEPCHGIGVIGNVTSRVDKCTGKWCTIDSFNCGGVIVNVTDLTESEIDSFSLEDCTVVSMDCFTKIEYLSTYYTYPTDDCKIEKFFCGIEEVSDPLKFKDIVFNTSNSCFAQVRCNNNFTIFGYQAWEYKCSTQEMVCDGKVVDGEQVPATSNCAARNKPCPSLEIAEQCTWYSKQCPKKNTQGNLLGCAHIQDKTVACAAGKQNDCRLKTLDCGLVRGVDADNFNQSLVSCWNIQEVICQDERIRIGDNGTLCRVAQLQCGNEFVPFTTPTIPDGCAVSQIVCVGQTLLNTTCTTIDLGCKGGAQCVWQKHKSDCLSFCYQTQKREGCICPVDYHGSTCQTPNRFACGLSVTSREYKGCHDARDLEYLEEYQIYLDGDKADLECELDAELDFEVKVDCRLPKTADPSDHRFQYDVIDPKFAITNVTKYPWNLMLKVFNFNALSDINGSVKKTLTIPQMVGNETIAFKLQLNKLDAAKYLVGGRLWAEWKFENSKVMNGKHSMGRILLDVNGTPQIPGKQATVDRVLVAAIVIVLIILLSIALYIAVKVYNYYKSK